METVGVGCSRRGTGGSSIVTRLGGGVGDGRGRTVGTEDLGGVSGFLLSFASGLELLDEVKSV